MTDLPKGWEWTTLQDLASAEPRAMTDGPFGSNLKSAHYTDSGPRVIRLQNIGFGEFIDEKAHITESHFESLRAHEAMAGDLVVASLGQDLPRACLVPPTLGPAIVKADCIRVRLHPSVDPRYVNYALQRHALRRAVADQIHGVGRPRLGMGGIKELTVPLPPRAEQERIVAAIEEHLSRLDAAESALVSAEHRVTSLEQRLIDSVWRDGPLVTLDDLLAEPLANGRSVKSDPEGFPVLRLTSLRDRRIVLSERKGGAWSRADADPVLVHAGDFLVSRGNGSLGLVGRGGLVDQQPDPVAFPDTLIRVRVRLQEYDVRYLSLVWDSTPVRRQIEAQARTTAGIYKVNQEMLRQIKLPLPPMHQQLEIVRQVDDALVSCKQLSAGCQRLRTRSAILRRSILAAAFSGRLVPQDPNDEPASLLLERIRAERAAAPPKKRARKAKAT